MLQYWPGYKVEQKICKFRDEYAPKVDSPITKDLVRKNRQIFNRKLRRLLNEAYNLGVDYGRPRTNG